MKSKIAASISAVALLTVAFAPSAAFADDNFNKTGNTAISFTGTAAENGGLVLDEVPSFDFGSTSLGSAQLTATSSTPFKVTDIRGSEVGYSITAKATDLKSTTNKTLPTQQFLVSTASANGLVGLSDVNIFEISNTVLTSNGDPIGDTTAGTSKAVLTMATNGVKAEAYTGTINYTLAEDIVNP
ncbi:MAG: WxL domain-containing protein [Lactobacillales bacterium]|nr:WxL domain-containing protein [Lactobacillales bacterium]